MVYNVEILMKCIVIVLIYLCMLLVDILKYVFFSLVI